MRIANILSAVAVAGIVTGLATSADAGYVATTNANAYTYTGNDASPSVGDRLVITNGTFAAYQPDGMSDPQINANDLGNYKLTLDLFVTQANPVRFSGQYQIIYDLNLADTTVNGPLVSGGVATLNFNRVFLPNFAFEAGTFTQTQGPSVSNFADLSYGGLIGVQGGIFLPASNTLQFAITVPEPISMGSVAAAGLLGLRRRRRA